MKKLLVIVAVLALTLPVVASASNYTTAFKAGKYNGTINSVLPALNGKPVTMEVTTKGNDVVATVTYEGGKEVWTWNDTTLNQQEFDLATNKMTMQYGAKAPAATTGTSQKFEVNCKDKAKNDCDAGVDARNYWVLESSSPTTIKYIVFGIPKEKKGDPSIKAEKRHEFVFNKAN